MSDTMLLGVLRMPPKLWDNGAIDVAQRYGYYKTAADWIEKDNARIQELESKLSELYGYLLQADRDGESNIPQKLGKEIEKLISK